MSDRSEIEASSAPPGLTSDAVEPLLRTARLGKKLYPLGVCDSTNAFARRLLEGAPEPSRSGPAPHGAVVVADYQRAGRGRNRRAWAARPGQSLLFSIILRPGAVDLAPPGPRDSQRPGVRADLITIAAAVAVVRALERAGAKGCAIKWPNDVLDAAGRKVAGVLTERVTRGGRVVGWVAGIGMNVMQGAVDFPEAIRSAAASLSMLTGGASSRAQVLADVLEELEALLAASEEALFEAWRRCCSTLGRTVRVRVGAQTLVGSALGLEPEGGLLLRLESGRIETIRSGDVEELRFESE